MLRHVCCLVFALVFCGSGSAFGHFGMVIPSKNIMTQKERTAEFKVSFSHPFELVGMDMAKPARFYMVKDGKEVDLRGSLTESVIMGHKGWQTAHRFKRPGVYQFIMEPVPYWEPAEDLSIIHYTKTIVAAYGADTGWDTPVGLPTEILPLLRPFGNYAGNSFVGQVLIQGKPAAHVNVEVEFYNEGGKVQTVSDYHVAQVIKTDVNGVFSFTCPLAGWWGFSALSEADYTLKDPKGKEKPVELGAVLWMYFDGYRF
jgi:cobalt/nickel transport protein